MRRLVTSVPYPRPVRDHKLTTSVPNLAYVHQSSLTDRLSDPNRNLVNPVVSKPTPIPQVKENSGVTQQKENAKSRCPLENLTLPPVGTSDHYLERCYCYLCKCGEHKCPAEIKKRGFSPSARSTWKSNYKREYTKREQGQGQQMQVHMPYFIPGPRKMDLITTKQQDYKPPNVEPVRRPPKLYQKNTIKCVTRSSYERDFPNWKPEQTVLFKSTELPYRGDIVGFNTKSTYQEDFEQSSHIAEHAPNAAKRKRFDPIAVLSDFYGNTSNRSQFQKPSTAYVSEKQSPKQNVRNQSELFITPQIHSLTTTYRDQFHQKDTPQRMPFKNEARRAASTYAMPQELLN